MNTVKQLENLDEMLDYYYNLIHLMKVQRENLWHSFMNDFKEFDISKKRMELNRKHDMLTAKIQTIQSIYQDIQKVQRSIKYNAQ